VLQLVQARPPPPQAALLVPGTQLPPWQQPVAQLLAVQVDVAVHRPF